MPEPISESAFIKAARKLGISDLWIKLFLLDVEGDKISPVMWSHWKHGRRPVDPERLLEFIGWLRNERTRVRAELDKDVGRPLIPVASSEPKKKARDSGKRGERG